MRFENNIYLWALLLIPAMIILFLMIRRWKNKARLKFADSDLMDVLLPDLSNRKHALKFILFTIAFLLLIIGLANPQMGTKLEEVKREGIDLMVAVDVSNSMKAEDLSPNRLERTKRALEKLIGNLKNDRIGLIVFAGEAFVQLPITSDYAAAKLFAATINSNLIPVQGTAIGAAINTAITSLEKDESKSKALVIITDGENHEDNAVEIAKKAAEKGITVHTIGMGSAKGAPIPIYKNGRNAGYRTDKAGNTVISQLNQTMLQQIASAGNGNYVRASNANSGLDLILNEIDKMEKKEYGSKEYTDYEDRFQPFIIAALLLLLVEFFIPERKSKWLRNINLFDTKK